MLGRLQQDGWMLCAVQEEDKIQVNTLQSSYYSLAAPTTKQ